ncbi:MAG: TetR/AcrR family transcriptional regulator [bacterium]
MRQAILDAAMRLFIEEGYEAVSIRRIAEKIEYSPSTIYLYFEDKDAIFFELHTLGFTELYKHQMEVQNISDPRERLTAHGRAYLSFALEHPEYYDLMFILKSPGLKIKECNTWVCGNRTYDLLKQNVLQCKEAGFFKDHDVDSISFVFWSIVHGMVSLHMRNRLIHFDTTGHGFNPLNLFEQALNILRSFIV